MQVAHLSSNNPLLLLPHSEQLQQQKEEEEEGEHHPNPNPKSSPDLSPFGSDFGGLIHTRPAAALRPLSSSDVAAALRLSRICSLPIAPRGNGHSINGQAQAHRGLILDMRFLNSITAAGAAFADVGAGALWSEVLAWSVSTLKLAPPSWTDYLDLTVGGTLSNAGISGQAFRCGPQVSNVAELEVVTADGDCHVCSPDSEADLFFAVLGGLGQFGVITRARIPLFPAPDMVKWIRVVYGRFEDYKADAELLVSKPEFEAFDYIEGFAFVNSDDPINGYCSVPLSPESVFDSCRVPPDSSPLLYCLELALHYRLGDNADQRSVEMLRPLKSARGLEFATELSYVSFLTRVKTAEEEARANGTWHAPHPWLNLLVSSADIVDFDRHVFKKILKDGIGGPMLLVYPLVRSKWDPRTSVALPASEIFYLVALLRFTTPFPDGPPVEELIDQNRQIIDCCRFNNYDFKLYLPHYKTEAKWEQHFGKGWSRFVDRKRRYDPTGILSPGQQIFSNREN